MSEFRQNPITKAWVLFAPARNKKPDQYRTYSVMRGEPELDPRCVFCPGNEYTNPEILRSPKNDNWELRVIPNKFPSLQHSAVYSHKDFYVSHSGDGDHEVIITRKHNEPVALQSVSLVEKSLKLFQQRLLDLSVHPELAYAQIFHNHGRDAGASIIHPHYQLLATPIVPPHIHNEIMGCKFYYDNNQNDIYGDMTEEELKIRDRIVLENEHFVVFSAYSSRKPFETWIMPRRRCARFEDASADEIKHLSFVLKAILGMLYTKLSDPPLNFYIHTLPFKKDQRKFYDERAFRWHLTVFPRITIWAGFEYATGIPVNPMLPEETARFLRGEE